MAQDNTDEYSEVTFPKHRQMLGVIAGLTPKHYQQALLEFDVTDARMEIRRLKERTGEKLSFTGWIIKCIAQAVSEFKHIQAYRKGGRLIIFNDVDVGLTLEREVDEEKVVTGYVIRKANEKTLLEIHNDIRAAQKAIISGALVGDGEDSRTVARIQSLPRILKRGFLWWYRRNPVMRKRTQGTVGLSSVGMFGSIRGWPLVLGPYPVFFGVGGVTEKVRVVDNRMEPRDFLAMSVMLDHDSVDGADAARFLVRLGELLQNSYGIES
ncbi:MAG: 2-oxo acid dehydrogenase subunit E2 [Candidatus Thorarchaeota archaeon]